MTDAEKLNVELKEVNQEVASAQFQAEPQETTTAAPAQVSSSSRSVSSNYVSRLHHCSLILEPWVIKPIPKIVTAAPATNIPPPIHPFISHSQQSTPIPTPTIVEATTSTTTIPKSTTLSAVP
ncbi:hypothetical protein Tco_1417632 [Tanacetum coccineum]